MWQATQLAPAEPAGWKWCSASRSARRDGIAAQTPFPGARRLQAVRVVAVAARHAGRVHAALQERPVLVDLVVDLAVGVIEPRVEQRRQVRVHERRAVAYSSESSLRREWQRAQSLDLVCRCAARRSASRCRSADLMSQPTPRRSSRTNRQPFVRRASTPGLVASPTPRGASPGRDRPRTRRRSPTRSVWYASLFRS